MQRPVRRIRWRVWVHGRRHGRCGFCAQHDRAGVCPASQRDHDWTGWRFRQLVDLFIGLLCCERKTIWLIVIDVVIITIAVIIIIEPSVLLCCWFGIRKNIQPVKNWVMRCWCAYMSGVRCRLFAYGPADATASPDLLISCLIYIQNTNSAAEFRNKVLSCGTEYARICFITHQH